MKIRTVNILGFGIDIYNFGYAQYMYPNFNGNAEFKVSHDGFRKLHHYLRNIFWMQKQSNLVNYKIETNEPE